MNFRAFIKNFFILSFSIFILSACGYKPSSHYAKKELDGSVFVKLHIDLKDPRNAVIIKDSVNQLLIQRLDNTLVYKEELADIVMSVKIDSVSMQELQYDAAGYNKLYRAIVKIKVSYVNKTTKKRASFTVEGENNFSIDDGTTITDTKRFLAIRAASDDALTEILSKIAVASFK